MVLFDLHKPLTQTELAKIGYKSAKGWKLTKIKYKYVLKAYFEA